MTTTLPQLLQIDSWPEPKDRGAASAQRMPYPPEHFEKEWNRVNKVTDATDLCPM